MQIKSWKQGTKHFPAEWGLRTRTVAVSPFESLEASLQNTALFPAHKQKLDQKRASCAYLKPFVIKVKYSSPLS